MDTIKIAVKPYKPMPISQLHSLQKDLKVMSEESYKKLRQEILDTGFAFMPHIWRDKNGKHWLVDGHQRISACEKMEAEGIKVPKIPTAIVQAKTINEARRRILQGISQYGKITEKGFEHFIELGKFDTKDIEMRFDLPDFNLPHFVESHFRADPLRDEIEDELPEEPKRVDVKSGELFILGEHRLLCGDSTDIKQVERLMDGEKADMVFTDPPYGMNVVKPDGNIGGVRKGSVGWAVGTMVGESKFHKAKVGVYRPIIGDDKPYDPSHLMDLAPIKIIWGANHFSDKLPCSPHWIVWNKEMPEGADFSGAELAWTNIDKKAVKVFKFTWAGMTREGNRKEELSKRVHPTQKPVGLFSDILNHYEPKSVIDVFGGSGSTLIACEKTKRKCFMMEIDPHYCHVILDRWAQYSGKDPVREDGTPWSKIKSMSDKVIVRKAKG